jgi:4-amino-4-deoxy-L-arabinose transferase-like glycosyltransferase
MSASKPEGNKGDVYLWWASGIALVALVLRLSMINFPVGVHPDESIIASLTKRSVDHGILTANWAGFDTQSATEWWSRPTYQFSPYTLVQSGVAKLAHGLSNSPSSFDGYVLLARVSSCCWGSVAVLLVFFLGRACFSSAAALWGEATLATCFLQVQDSIYARVDTFLSCLVLLSLILTIRAVKRPQHLPWLAAASLCVGVTVAAKYNAFPVLLLIPFIPFRWARTGAIPWSRAVLLAIAGLLVVGIGFAGATPEILWRPGPWLAGLQYEIVHYTTAQIPHQAHGWEDNNLFYWTRYLAWLGFGLLPLCFALSFVYRIIALRRWEDFLLGTFLAVVAVLVLATKLRFERNWEICLGPLALAAGATAWDLLCRVNRSRNMAVSRFLCVAFALLWFLQPVRVLYHFRETLNYPGEWKARINKLLLKHVPSVSIFLNEPLPESVVNGCDQVVLIDFGDPFSADGAARWKRFLGGDPAHVLTSPWAEYDYPFSTVDIYHGPRQIFIYQGLTKPAAVAPSAPPAVPAGEK